jgi:hypothetical protein
VAGGLGVDPLAVAVLPALVDQHGDLGDLLAGWGEPDLRVVGQVALEGDGGTQDAAPFVLLCGQEGFGLCSSPTVFRPSWARGRSRAT